VQGFYCEETCQVVTYGSLKTLFPEYFEQSGRCIECFIVNEDRPRGEELRMHLPEKLEEQSPVESLVRNYQVVCEQLESELLAQVLVAEDQVGEVRVEDLFKNQHLRLPYEL